MHGSSWILNHAYRSQCLRLASMKQPTMYSYMASHRYLYQNVFTTHSHYRHNHFTLAITQMNQTWHKSKHSRHSKVGITYMAQSTPTHASGFHLITVAMTGHAEDKGSTTVAHSNLKCCCLKCSRWEQAREHGILSIWSIGGCLPGRLVDWYCPSIGYSR